MGTSIDMAQTCQGCGKDSYRVRLVGKRFLGVDCCIREVFIASTANPYGDLTLNHIHDEKGQPVRVTSSRQLAEAEVRFNFSSCVRNMEQKNFDAPPQARRQGIGETYQRKFDRGR
jgi:hypothetical protein